MPRAALAEIGAYSHFAWMFLADIRQKKDP